MADAATCAPQRCSHPFQYLIVGWCLTALSDRSHHNFIHIHISGLLDRKGNGTGDRICGNRWFAELRYPLRRVSIADGVSPSEIAQTAYLVAQ